MMLLKIFYIVNCLKASRLIKQLILLIKLKKLTTTQKLQKLKKKHLTMTNILLLFLMDFEVGYLMKD